MGMQNCCRRAEPIALPPHPEVGEDVAALHVLGPQSNLPVRVRLILQGNRHVVCALPHFNELAGLRGVRPGQGEV